MKTFLQSLPETFFFIFCIAGLVYAAWFGDFAVGIVAAVSLIAFLTAVIKPVTDDSGK